LHYMINIRRTLDTQLIHRAASVNAERCHLLSAREALPILPTISVGFFGGLPGSGPHPCAPYSGRGAPMLCLRNTGDRRPLARARVRVPLEHLIRTMDGLTSLFSIMTAAVWLAK
jgi:hypothetical protein